MKKTLCLAVLLSILGAVSVARAQTPTYSFVGFIKKGVTYLDADVVAHQKVISGRFSVSADFLMGVNATDVSGNLGGLFAGNYDLGKNRTVFAGIAYTRPLAGLSFQNFDAKDIVFAVGFRSAINWQSILHL